MTEAPKDSAGPAAAEQVLEGDESPLAAQTAKEPMVVITGVSFDDSPANKDRNLLPVRIAYRVIQSQVEGNLVYPFYREPRQSAPPRQFRSVAGK